MIDTSLFKLNDQTLQIDQTTCHLNAFRWDSPHQGTLYLVFAGDDLHIITLEETEPHFTQVASHNETQPVRLIVATSLPVVQPTPCDAPPPLAMAA